MNCTATEEHFRDRERTVHLLVTRLPAISAGEEADAGGVAFRGVVELGEAQAVGGEAVEVRGFDLSAVAADIGVTEVVC